MSASTKQKTLLQEARETKRGGRGREIEREKGVREKKGERQRSHERERESRHNTALQVEAIEKHVWLKGSSLGRIHDAACRIDACRDRGVEGTHRK